MRSSCLKLDWLHIADQGVTAFLMGSILCLFVDPPGQPDFGSTIAARALTIWHFMDRWYRDNKVAIDRLKSLPVTRFRTKSPCLKGQGATVRKLVPFFVHLKTWITTDGVEEVTARNAMIALSECYRCKSP